MQKSNEQTQKKYKPPFFESFKNQSIISTIIHGLNLIVIGGMLLLNTTGVVGWGVWNRALSIVLKFWPILLIFIGLKIIFSAGIGWKIFFKILGFLLFISLLVISADAEINKESRTWLEEKLPFINRINETPELLSETNTVNFDKYQDQIDKREIDLEITTGELNFEDDSAEPNFLTIDSQYYKDYGVPEIQEKTEGKTLKINFKPKFETGYFWFGKKELQYNLKAGATSLPTDVYLKTTAGKSQINLDQLNLKDLKVEMTAGEVQAKITGQALPETINLDLTAGNLALILPRRAGLEINYDLTAGTLKIDDKKLDRGPGNYEQNPDAETQTQIDIEITAGSVEIQFE